MVCCTLLRLSLVLGVALLAACAQQPGKPLALLQAEVFTANRKAESRFHQGDWVGAAGQYQEALCIARSIEDAIDRELALPRKIFLDLFHLGRASESGGSLAAALAYYGRALAVSAADGDVQAGLEARQRIRLLEERRGEHQGPENREGAD